MRSGIIGNAFFQAEAGVNFGDVAVNVSLVRTGLTIYGRDRFGQWKIDPGLVKEITGLFPMIRGLPGTVIKVSVGFQDDPNDPVTWEGPYDYVLGQNFFQDFTIAGKYLAVRFESVGQESWELVSYDLDIELVGGR